MDTIFSSLPANLTQILVIIAVLAVVWIAIRFIFRLAFRVMALGCLGIVILGVLLAAWPGEVARMPTVEQARSWYQSADPVHDFSHVLRVYAMAERLARSEGADVEIVRAAALLHDAEGSAPGGDAAERANHHHSSADFAGEVLRAEGWPDERIAAVQHCIRAHRFRDRSEPPQTLEARILFDADKLDVIGAIGAARTIAYAVLDGQPVYAEPSASLSARPTSESPASPTRSYHEYLFKLSKIKDRLFTPAARALAQERDQYLADFYARLAAEMRGEK